MGVIAQYIDPGGAVFKFEFECGTFDLADENSGLDGWEEIARDCDHWPATRRRLNYYASGPKSLSDAIFNFSERVRFRKYFETTDDTVRDVLSLTDVNGGKLPTNPCAWIEVYQNGKSLPCEGWSVDYTAKTITISEAWRVPGAAYEVKFQAQPISS